MLRRRRPFAVLPGDRRDGAAIAALHGASFARGWSEAELDGLLAQPGVRAFLARSVGRPKASPLGFVLMRSAADEAEILTIAVDGGARRRGVGRALMDAAIRDLQHDRAARLFLEVDEVNRAAIALYRRLGFSQVGERASYYGDGGRALTMALDLGSQAGEVPSGGESL